MEQGEERTGEPAEAAHRKAIRSWARMQLVPMIRLSALGLAWVSVWDAASVWVWDVAWASGVASVLELDAASASGVVSGWESDAASVSALGVVSELDAA